MANRPPSTSGSTPSITTRRSARTDCPISVVATLKGSPFTGTNSFGRRPGKSAAGTRPQLVSSIIYRKEAQNTSTQKLLPPGVMFLYLPRLSRRARYHTPGLFPRPPLQQWFEALLLELLFHFCSSIRIAVGAHRYSIQFIVAVPEHHRREFLLPQFLRHGRCIVFQLHGSHLQHQAGIHRGRDPR